MLRFVYTFNDIGFRRLEYKQGEYNLWIALLIEEHYSYLIFHINQKNIHNGLILTQEMRRLQTELLIWDNTLPL